MGGGEVRRRDLVVRRLARTENAVCRLPGAQGHLRRSHVEIAAVAPPELVLLHVVGALHGPDELWASLKEDEPGNAGPGGAVLTAVMKRLRPSTWIRPGQ